MPQQLNALFLALMLSLILTPIVRWVAHRVGALARPVERSVHRVPVPHLGGVALYLAFSVSVLATVGWREPAVTGVLLGGFAILVVGVVDDIKTLRPGAKMAGQLVAALILVALGTRIGWVTNPWGGLLVLGYMSIPLTIFWVISFVNIVNLIDGLDGLAAGITTIASLVLLVMALRTDQALPVVVMGAALTGSALGFLPFNFNPAKIFMGDGGAMFLGFALAALSVEGLLKSTLALAFIIPVVVLGLPVFDTALAIHRRWRQGLPVSGADSDHLHHRLLRLGFSHREAVLAMYGVSAWLGLGALAMVEATVSQALAILTLSAVLLYLGAKRVGILDLREGKEFRR